MNEPKEESTRPDAADRIMAAYSAINRWAAQDFKRAKAPSDLTSTQFAILALVDRSSMTVSHLADRLDLTIPTVVRAVDALERKGLVERRRSSYDQREVMIATTPEGMRLRGLLEDIRRGRLLQLFSNMSPEEIDGLLLGLEGLARAVSGEGGPIEAGAREEAG